MTQNNKVNLLNLENITNKKGRNELFFQLIPTHKVSCFIQIMALLLQVYKHKHYILANLHNNPILIIHSLTRLVEAHHIYFINTFLPLCM